MLNHNFKVGDIVHLNFDPEILMMVLGFTQSGQIHVMYRKSKLKRCCDNYGYRSFAPQMLTLVKKKN